MTDPREREENQRREALTSLKQLTERDTFATSALARTAQLIGGATRMAPKVCPSSYYPAAAWWFP